MSWHPLTWVIVTVGVIAVPAALWMPDGSSLPVRAVERVDSPAPAAVPPETPPAAPGGPAVMAPLASLTETTARPLFSTTRRPPPPEPAPESVAAPVVESPAAPPPAPVERTEFVVVGIVQRPEGPFVLLKPKAGGAVVTAREGEDTGGWHVQAIGPTEVRLTSPAGNATHVLFAPRPTAGATPGPALPFQ